MELVSRAGDILARIGGDEFVVVLPNTDQEGAEKYVKKVLSIFNEANKESGIEAQMMVSLDLGICTQGPDDEKRTQEEIFEIADHDMYKKKRERKIKEGKPLEREK